VELRDSWASVIRTPAHACLQSTHHRLGVFRRVGYSGFESAAQRLSPTRQCSRHRTGAADFQRWAVLQERPDVWQP